MALLHKIAAAALIVAAVPLAASAADNDCQAKVAEARAELAEEHQAANAARQVESDAEKTMRAATRALAFGDASLFVPAIAQHGGKWDARLGSLRRLSWELQRRTSIEVSLEVRPMPLAR